MLFLTSLISPPNNVIDVGSSIIQSILKVLVMYYLVMPYLLSYTVDKFITDNSLINNYIKEKISFYEKSLRSINPNQLFARGKELEQGYYKDLFIRINDSRNNGENKEIPSLKYLAAFYVKNNTNLDVDKLSASQKIKAYINSF